MVAGFVVAAVSRTSDSIESAFDLVILTPWKFGGARPEGVEPPTYGFEGLANSFHVNDFWHLDGQM